MKQTLLLGFACLVLSTAVYAHREEESLTTIMWNPRSEMMEVIHQIHQHDAQYVLNKLPGLDKDSRDLDSLRGKAHIALLVEEAFVIQLGEKPALIEFVGATLDSEFIVVMQEFALGDIDRLTMRFSPFDSIFDDFISRVTMLFGGVNKTVFFNSKNVMHTFELPEQH